MSSSQRPSENSVLFSLRELRRIEDDRVKKEQDAARAKAEAERQAREEADRLAREAEERRVREEAERARMAKEAVEQREREEQLRLQEAERRARVEGEMRINEERMRLEMQHKKKHSPIKAVLGVAGALVLLGGGIGYKMYSQHQTELAAERAERERIAAQARKERAELEAKLVGIEKNMNDQLAKAKTEEERARIRAAAAEAKAVAQGKPAPRHAGGTKTEADTKKTVVPTFKKREISDNPLDGF
jgi:colicin import membrane protein